MKTKIKITVLCSLIIVSSVVSGCRPANTPPTPEVSPVTNPIAPATPTAPTSTNQPSPIPTTGEPTKP